MLGRRLGPRFGLEAVFIIAVAIVAGLLELTWEAILAAVFGAWLLVVAAELVALRLEKPVEEAAPEAEGEVELEPPPPPAPVFAPPAFHTEEEHLPAAEPELEPATEREPEPAPTAEAPAPPALRPAPLLPVTAPPLPTRAAPPPEPLPVGPREWNLWELERLARERAGEDPVRDEERSFLLMYLREFASPDGVLPREFDGLVRESFGDLLASARR